jgi:NaMN:DMB phosphoribosyltransferase
VFRFPAGAAHGSWGLLWAIRVVAAMSALCLLNSWQPTILAAHENVGEGHKLQFKAIALYK